VLERLFKGLQIHILLKKKKKKKNLNSNVYYV